MKRGDDFEPMKGGFQEAEEFFRAEKAAGKKHSVTVREGWVLLGHRQVAELKGRTVEEIQRVYFPKGELESRKHPTEPNNTQVRVERGWVDCQ